MGKHSAKGWRKKDKIETLDVPPRRKSRATGGAGDSGMLEPAPQMRVHRERKRRTRRRVLLAILTLILAACLGAAGWAYAFVNAVDADLAPDTVEEQEALEEVLTEPEPQEPFTILLVGSDVRPDEEAARADTIILAKVDPLTDQVWMLSIPRDTRVDIPGYGVNKINAANFHGGPELLAQTVTEFLDVPINYYMELDFAGFEAMIDAMGGVWIDVPMEIDDWKASSHSPSHRASHIDEGYQLLTGEYALTFVRSRDFVDADWQRMRNQQLFFRELASQSTRWENLFKLPAMVSEFAEYATTNASVSELVDIGRAMGGITAESMHTATVPGEWRSPYVVTDEVEMARLVQAMLDGEPFEPSVEEEDVIPSDVSVAVRNGAGIGGVAGEAADVLEAAGFDIAEVGNANQFVYEETFVVYDGELDEPAAALVAESLGIGVLVQSRGMYAFSTDILVVVGKDWPSRVTTETVPGA